MLPIEILNIIIKHFTNKEDLIHFKLICRDCSMAIDQTYDNIYIDVFKELMKDEDEPTNKKYQLKTFVRPGNGREYQELFLGKTFEFDFNILNRYCEQEHYAAKISKIDNIQAIHSYSTYKATLTNCNFIKRFGGLSSIKHNLNLIRCSDIPDIYELLGIPELHLHASSFHIYYDRYDEDIIAKLYGFRDKLCNQKDIYFMRTSVKRPGKYKHNYVWCHFINHSLFSEKEDNIQTIRYHNSFRSGHRIEY